MPRKRKYNYQKDLPVKMAIYVKLPVEIVNELEKLGIVNKELSKKVEKYLLEYVENNREKD